ncbi:TIGR03757 family integrating conjugative element protein [Buttiauxella selenatireducens]|uniref:TIGR03757 family integrating conjugative element protein n=1 Tax=Buttiauxella selenatireducens TaxID=3073902 RepID=A0ABY9S4P2_9ENTR|nr:TIGR03757 family integrating conjugative element protein [Buttiauxella sp. R73]WMY72466.1 TIGR03757 family integrating conjugative element protein [Buttiauxella sp. R73]
MPRYLFFSPCILYFVATSVFAQAVVYTTKRWPVEHPEPGVVVQVLEEVVLLEKGLFPSLSDNTQEAEKQAQLRMQQPDWHEQEARLTHAYQALLEARAVGIAKIPAVVFDDRFVVYGTTDVALAQQLRDAWQAQQP